MIVMGKNKLASAIATVIGAAGVVGLAPVVQAADEEAKLDKVTVTGSRIRRADIEGSSSVQIIDRAQIDREGVVNIGQLLRELPSVAGGADTPQVNNGGGGAFRLELRGLGTQRTLILLNGRRIVPSGGGAGASVDLNTIPVDVIERIEVLKDGASPVYGSDAIAGVVNIITRNDIEGFELSGQFGETKRNDGKGEEFSITYGRQLERGSFMFNASYADEEIINAADRTFAEFALGTDFVGTTVPLGSTATPGGRFTLLNGNNNLGLPVGTQVTRGSDAEVLAGDPNAIQGFRQFAFPDDTFNFAPVNTERQPVERFSFSLFGDYRLGELPRLGSINAFVEASYLDRESEQRLAPEPLAPTAFSLFPTTFSSENVFNQFGSDVSDFRRRTLEQSNRFTTTENETFRFVFGLNGETEAPNLLGGKLFPSELQWEAFFIYGQNNNRDRGGGNFDLDRVTQAVGPTLREGFDAATGTNGTGAFVTNDDGEFVCLSTIQGGDSDCVSLNVAGIFGLEGAPADNLVPVLDVNGNQVLNPDGSPRFSSNTQMTASQLAFTTFNQNELGDTDQRVYAFNINGELLDLGAFGLPSGVISFASGYEFREEQGSDLPDAMISNGNTTANDRQPTTGEFDVEEFYYELSIPILVDMPFVKRFTIDTARRISDFDTFGKTSNGKIAAKWDVTDGLSFRYAFTEAFRAPTIGQLFLGTSEAFPSLTIFPCANNPSPACIANGVPVGGFAIPQTTQTSTLTGGNQALDPEEADIYTFGVVLEPGLFEPLSFLDGLSISVDAFDINIDRPISGIGINTILRSCAGGAVGNEFCQRVARFDINTAGGDATLVGVPMQLNNALQNVGSLETEGVDLDMRYRFSTRFGDFSLGLNATYVDEFDVTQSDGTIIEHAGNFLDNNAGNFPRFRSTFNLGFQKGNFGLGWQIRVLDSVEEPTQQNLQDGDGNVLDQNGNIAFFAGTNLPAQDFNGDGMIDDFRFGDDTFAGVGVIGLREQGFKRDLGNVIFGDDGNIQSIDFNNVSAFRDLPSIVYHDVQLSYFIEELNTDISFGVDNVFDKDPPFSESGFNDNTDVRTFDTRGRFYYGKISTRF